MRIGIDGRFLTHPQRGGFKTYTTNLVSALAEVDSTNQYTVFVTEDAQSQNGGLESQLRLPTNFEVVRVGEPLGALGMPLREQILLPKEIGKRDLDLFHAPALTAPFRLKCPLVITIHDMLWQQVEKGIGFKRASMQRYYRHVTERVAKRSQSIITVSHHARQEILENLDVAPECVKVVYESAGEDFKLVDDLRLLDAARRKYGLEGKYLIALGSADPRKNVSGLLEMYAALPEALRCEHRLLVVWAHSRFIERFQEKARSLGIADSMTNATGVSNQELAALYTMASAFIFPSLGEGFGLPMLEAMRCGTPVVAANNSSIPEIGGDAALYYQTLDIAAGAEALAKVLQDARLAQEIRQAGYHRASEFTWKRCAEQTLSIYRSAMESWKA